MSGALHRLRGQTWAALAGALLASGCSAKSPAVSHDAGPDGGRTHDAAGEGGVDAADDDDASSDFDASLGFDATGLPSIDAGGPPACHGSTDCSVGSLCCFDVGAVRAPASCVVGAACPTDDAQLCGVSGDEKCKTGTCADYECTATTPHVQLTFFACAVPALPTVSCGIVEPSEDAGEP